MKIAIVGMGVAGVSVLKEMSKYPIFKDQEIVIYDSPETIGTGLPYQPDTDVLLLNQPADTMSMDQDKKLGFAEWIEEKKVIRMLLKYTSQDHGMASIYVK
ncbi:FAD/NAD(P)-binding protein [Jeotgalibaca sp. MA1X17-3]|uniref:FAD/NAD(P)-binding protein n=1 Tax=Jeotgalibaca sp. MA1X17-3 TaxID=2908211 RepID=UPI001F3D002A|nr:FAD/NAD(P)-binding protein [Jeotgalibaca sp. MA1X17-3]UJF15682.1 FAD/NAD(P)-binding protein [Jeotgalibaca sp. MA1X17-3]